MESKKRTRTIKEIESSLKYQGIEPLSLYSANPSKLKDKWGIPLQVPGVTAPLLNLMIEAVIIHYAEYHTYPSGTELQSYVSPPVAPHVPFRMLENKIFLEILIRRGLPRPDAVLIDKDTGQPQSVLLSEALSAKQLLALSILSDVTSKIPFKQRLAKADVTWSQWQNWMRNANFHRKHDAICREIFIKSQASIDIQLASGALDGRLDFIKYYNEVSGRHDPKTQSRQDVQKVLQAVVEIITRNVTDITVLEKINADMQIQLNQLDL